MSVSFPVTVAGRKFFISYIISRVDSVESVQLDFKDAWKIQCSSFVEQTMLEWSPSNRVITFSPGVSQVSHNFFHIILMMLRESSFLIIAIGTGSIVVTQLARRTVLEERFSTACFSRPFWPRATRRSLHVCIA